MIEVVSGESLDVIMRLCAGWDRGQRGLQLMHTRHGWRARYLDDALVPSAGAGKRVALTGTLFETIQESEVVAGFALMPSTVADGHRWMAWLITDDGIEPHWVENAQTGHAYPITARLLDLAPHLMDALELLGNIVTEILSREDRRAGDDDPEDAHAND